MFKKLLTAVSISALSAGSAHALNISTTAPITPALELSLPGTTPGAFSVPANFTLNTDSGAYPTGTAMLVTITLPAGVTFAADATATNISGATNTLNVTLSSGGVAGVDSTVSYLVTDNAGGETGIRFTGPLGLTACPAPGAGIIMTANVDGSGTPVDGGTALSSAIISPCASALDGTVVADATDTAVALAGGYLQLNENGGVSTNGPLPIGDVNYTINPAVAITGTGTAMTSADITSISFDVVFADASNITNVDLSTGDAAVITGNTATFTITGNVPLLVDGAVDVINVIVSGANPLPAQVVSVSNAVVTFNDGVADLVPTEPGAVGPIDALQREGKSFGVFDWNSGTPGARNNVYRVTGFSSTAPVNMTITMSNSDLVPFGTMDYPGTVTPDANGEVVLTSTSGFNGIVPAFIRGDALFNFETIDNLDVDRLMAKNGIVTNFGDGANSNLAAFQTDTPSQDSDAGFE